MDIKIAGITEEIMKVALDQAQGRPPAHPRRDGQGARPARAPSSASTRRASRRIKIPTDKIRDVIGSGGKVIREIVEKTGAKINIEDDGTVKIASADGNSIKAAINWIKSIAAEPEVGQIYDGTVVKTDRLRRLRELLRRQGRPRPHLAARQGPRRQDAPTSSRKATR